MIYTIGGQLQKALNQQDNHFKQGFDEGPNTYGGLLDGGEHTSGLNHILGTSLTPFNVSRVPPENRESKVTIRCLTIVC